ncbi:leucine-rich repeat-containing protein 71 [Aulostomus maculatus]
MKNIPAVKTEPPASPYPDAEGEKTGWGVDEQIVRVLVKLLPSLSTLQNLEFWQARLTDPMVISLVNGISLCSSLRVVVLEGNPLPEHSYHLLLSEESLIGKISLRNNRIGDEGARLMGAALSTPRSASKNLWSLNLAFNWIGDAGAAHIAQGLRLNRALLILSLSNNRIGDSGAASLATILGEFALTHEEVVERRKLLLERQSCAETVEIVHPLLDKSVQCRDGNVFLPGNTRLVSLNLSGNRITEEPLSLFLSSLQKQGEGPGLLRLCLQRNRIPPESEPYVKIKELMTLRDPLNKDRGKTGEMGAKG